MSKENWKSSSKNINKHELLKVFSVSEAHAFLASGQTIIIRKEPSLLATKDDTYPIPWEPSILGILPFLGILQYTDGRLVAGRQRLEGRVTL